MDIIVVDTGRPKCTKLTIEALLKTNDDIRVILVNNGDLYNLKIDKVNVINLDENLGQAQSTNVGLNVSNSEYVCCMHSDYVVNDKNWISKAVNFLKSNKKAGLVGVFGWKINDEGKFSTVSSKTAKGFEEVVRTDCIINIFKNDGIRANENQKVTLTDIWIEILARGKKLYIMQLNDAEHLENKVALPKIIENDKELKDRHLKCYLRHQRANVMLTRLKEYKLEHLKIFEYLDRFNVRERLRIKRGGK